MPFILDMASWLRMPNSPKSVVNDNGIKFIGPTPDMINAMGDKITAKETMIACRRACGSRWRRAVTKMWMKLKRAG
jgi:biotin carboxylase